MQSATYNCNVTGTTINNGTTFLYVAEWLVSTTCGSFFSSPSTSNQPDYVWNATYRTNGTGDCMAGATYQNKSMTSSVQLYSQVFCRNNGNGASSAASVPRWMVALVIVLAALSITW